MIDAAVNGGIANFQEAFFTGDFASQHPDLAVHIPTLKALIQEEVGAFRTRRTSCVSYPD